MFIVVSNVFGTSIQHLKGEQIVSPINVEETSMYVHTYMNMYTLFAPKCGFFVYRVFQYQK